LPSPSSHRSERTHPAYFSSITSPNAPLCSPPHQAEKTMAQKTPSRKRPCRICGKWFMPNARLGARQKTCGANACKQQWHTAKCAEWNRQNGSYFKENYLKSRIESVSGAAAEPPPTPSISRTKPGSPAPSPLHLPREAVQEVMGVQQRVIIEYLARLLLRGVQEVISDQRLEISNEFRQLVNASSLRGDGQPPPAGVSSSC